MRERERKGYFMLFIYIVPKQSNMIDDVRSLVLQMNFNLKYTNHCIFLNESMND